MRNVCQVDVTVSTKIKSLAPPTAAAHVFSDFRGCRVLSVVIIGSRLAATLLLPEVPGGYSSLSELRALVEIGLTGKGVVLDSVYGLREATAIEVLDRTLSRRKD
jgi:hypothetical protein